MTAVPTRHEEWPGVSVIVPTRDRPHLLRRALAAIQSQDYAGEIETIVIADGTDPASVEVPTGVHVIANDGTPGTAGARNAGIRHATQPLVAYCDDDDEWMP